jgi:hypothetical protein
MRSFLIFTTLFSLIAFSGCRTLNKGVSSLAYDLMSKRKSPGNISGGSSAKYSVPKTKDSNDLVGKVSVGAVEVSYMRGLDEMAQCIAGEVNESYIYVNNELGIRLNQTVRIYVHRLDSIPQNFEFHDTMDSNEFKFPIFVTPVRQSCSDAFNENVLSPMILFHELTEIRISITADTNVTVFGDIDAGIFKFKNYTRWYREGLATYTGYIASAHIAKNFPHSILKEKMFDAPFSSLARAKTNLFKWHQFEIKHGYYDASFGLFLLLEHRYGHEAMRSLVGNMYEHKHMDGTDLIDLVNNNFGINVEKVVEEFEFPRLGFESTQIGEAARLNKAIEVSKGVLISKVEPNSIAANAHIYNDDVITAINGKPVSNNFDIELAVLNALDFHKCTVTVWRRDKGTFETILEF